jgi:hypothetical protein
MTTLLLTPETLHLRAAIGVCGSKRSACQCSSGQPCRMAAIQGGDVARGVCQRHKSEAEAALGAPTEQQLEQVGRAALRRLARQAAAERRATPPSGIPGTPRPKPLDDFAKTILSS